MSQPAELIGIAIMLFGTNMGIISVISLLKDILAELRSRTQEGKQ